MFVITGRRVFPAHGMCPKQEITSYWTGPEHGFGCKYKAMRYATREDAVKDFNSIRAESRFMYEVWVEELC